MSDKDDDEKRQIKKQWIGDIAAFLSILAYIPLVTHVTLSKETKSLHYYWLFIASSAALMWAMYGIYNGLTPTIIAGIITLLYKISRSNAKAQAVDKTE